MLASTTDFERTTVATFPARALRAVLAGAAGLSLVLTASACSLNPWRSDKDQTNTSVFDLVVGDCTLTPEDVTVEVTKLAKVDCTVPHQQEVYAVVPYTDPATGKEPAEAPTDDALKTFADGACATEFLGYVGVDYRDSSLYFTYLLPSTRGWQQNDDRKIVCFVTTTGAMLTSSVKGTAL